MSFEILIAIASAFAAIVASIFALIGQNKVAKMNAIIAEKRDENLHKQQAKLILSKYREPLINATYELQSRIFNILRLKFLDKFYLRGNEREKQYAVENTIYVIAQYLGWIEIIRREIQFLDLGELETTKKLSALENHICELFLDTRLGTVLRIFRGNQRAIGEIMESNSQCLGYAEFVQNKDAAFQYWFEPLREDIELLAKELDKHNTRLIELQHALIDIIDFLDPDYIRYPQQRRGKI
jgi:hypothetical protein